MLKLVKVPIYRILVHVVLEQYSLEYPRYRSVSSALRALCSYNGGNVCATRAQSDARSKRVWRTLRAVRAATKALCVSAARAAHREIARQAFYNGRFEAALS